MIIIIIIIIILLLLLTDRVFFQSYRFVSGVGSFMSDVKGVLTCRPCANLTNLLRRQGTLSTDGGKRGQFGPLAPEVVDLTDEAADLTDEEEGEGERNPPNDDDDAHQETIMLGTVER